MSVNNVYSLANAELQRLHELLIHAQRNPDPHQHQAMGGLAYGGLSSGSSAGILGYPYSYGGMDVRTIYQKIDAFHAIILEAMKTMDIKIQEKVAELALTDVQKEKI
jgi:hypothetical protein